MSLDVPLSVKIEEWRRMAREGTFSIEEQRAMIIAVRAGRVGAAATSAASRARKAPVDVASLEDELDNL